MVAIAVGTVAVNAMNDYTGSLSLQAAGFRIKRVYSAAIVAVLGFLFTLYLNAQTDFAGNFTNFLLFISYWISPFVGVVLADWWLRRRHADVSRLSDFGGLPIGRRRDRGARHRLPGRASRSRTRRSATAGAARSTTITANYLHGADIAYYVGGIVAAVIYIIVARKSVQAEA